MNKLHLFQWGEMPTSVAYIGTGQIMGWGNKAIEVRIRYPFYFYKFVFAILIKIILTNV